MKPFEMRNVSFQKLLDRFRNGLPHVLVLAYLDDICVHSETYEGDLTDLKYLFERLRLFQLRVKFEK